MPVRVVRLAYHKMVHLQFVGQYVRIMHAWITLKANSAVHEHIKALNVNVPFASLPKCSEQLDDPFFFLIWCYQHFMRRSEGMAFKRASACKGQIWKAFFFDKLKTMLRSDNCTPSHILILHEMSLQSCTFRKWRHKRNRNDMLKNHGKNGEPLF